MKGPLEIVLEYIDRHWAPIPVPFKEKNPRITAWQKQRITRETAEQYFNSAAQNIGVILGPASGGLTDIDLDCSEAIGLTSYFLPRTGARLPSAIRCFRLGGLSCEIVSPFPKRLCPAYVDPWSRRAVSRRQVDMVGGDQIPPIPRAREAWASNYRLAGRRYSLPYRRDWGRSMNRPESKLAVSSHLASSTPEHPWPSFDGTKLPLSQPARQQLSRVYSDFRNYSAIAQRKSSLLRWIHSSAFDPIKGIHLPVSEIVETNAAAALNQSKDFARTPLNFPEMPPVPRFFSNALVVGTESPSLRATNAGLIIVSHEIDNQNLAEFEEVLAWTRGAKGDFNKSLFAELDGRLCGCREYRGYSIIYSDRRFLHFHFFLFDRLTRAEWINRYQRKDDAR